MEDGGEALSTIGFKDESWIFATVPGPVLTSFHDARALPDANFVQNQLHISDSFFYADFWYRTEFTPPAVQPGKVMRLDIAGINWKIDVYLGGARLGRIDGAFLRAADFDVTGKLLPGKPTPRPFSSSKTTLLAAARRNARTTARTAKPRDQQPQPSRFRRLGRDPHVQGRNDGIWTASTPSHLRGHPLRLHVTSVLSLPEDGRSTPCRSQEVSGWLVSFPLSDSQLRDTVQRGDGQNVTYDPARLKGVNVSREATGDRIQFTAPDRKLGVANRDLATVEKVGPNRLTVKLDGKKERSVSFDPWRMRHYDHGYAVTSHSSQGLTAGRVLANMDTEAPASLINTRLAYVAVSRASEDVRIYTNDAATLGARLATEVSKTAAVDFRPISNVEQLRQAVEALGKNETGKGVEMLQVQGRIREYADLNHRMAAVTIDYEASRGGPSSLPRRKPNVRT